MSDGRASFDELAGDDLSAAERDRLHAVHEQLLAAGAPPELPPSLARAPDEPTARVGPLRGRYRYTAFAAADTVALALFGAGYAIGDGGDGEEAVRTIAMAGPGGAEASIVIYPEDRAGNWPMRLEISGLEPLPPGQTYELWLTRRGKLADPCGTFVVSGETTKVPLNAPYRLKQYDGWVVVRTGATRALLSTA